MAKKKRARRKPGPPIKLGPRSLLRQKLLDHLRSGLSLTAACARCRITANTYYNQREREPAFAQAADDALAERIETLTALAYKHAVDDPKTCLHLLACLDPQYRKTDTQTHVHAHAHANVPPKVVYEIVDSRQRPEPGATSLSVVRPPV